MHLMDYLQTLVLAVVQGATEFIPVSSSGHLVLVREFLHWSDQGGVFMDTVLHAGSLMAILFYFRRDIRAAVHAVLHPSTAAHERYYRLLPWWLVLATLPVVAAGPFIEPQMQYLRKGGTVGMVMMLTAVWFLLCEGRPRKQSRPLMFSIALIMGTAQVFALLPGASRSGVTIGAGILLGLPRQEAARFSFFMAIPTIIGAAVLESGHLFTAGAVPFSPGCILAGFFTCFAVSLLSIDFCMKMFRKRSLLSFAVYLAALGLLLVLIRFSA